MQKSVKQLINDYCESNFKFQFNPEKPIVKLHEPTFGADEINDAIDVLLSTQVTMGDRVRDFEKVFAQKALARMAVMSNSGSSANLLILAALCNPAFDQQLKPGDEVIVSALSWSTTVWPIVQCGLVPVIVDIDPVTLNLDLDAVEDAISRKTRAVFPVHVYGNPCDMVGMVDLCERHGLILIEDCCEALGADFDGKPVGSFGLSGSFSFYFSHHITTLEGGISVTNQNDFGDLMTILRAHGWLRDLSPESRLNYASQDPELDERFLFVNVGYNLRPTEIQGAFGNRQIQKLDGLVESRRAVSNMLVGSLSEFDDTFTFQEEQAGGRSSCFGFPLILRGSVSFDVREIRAYLGALGIETRPIICGNVAKQPALRLFEHRVAGEMENASHVMSHGFSVGNHQYVTQEAVDYIARGVKLFLDSGS